MSRRCRIGARSRWLVVALCAVATVSCGPAEEPGAVDVLDRLAKGVFVQESGFWRLGRLPGQTELSPADAWTPMPLTPVAGWQWPGRAGWHPVGRRAVLEGPNRWIDASDPLWLELEWNRRRHLEGAQGITVSLNGERIGEAQLEADRLVQSIQLPEESRRAERLEIGLEFDPPLARGPEGLFPVTLGGFGLSRDRQLEDGYPPGAGFGIDEDRRVIRILRSGQLVTTLDLPAPTGRIGWELRCRGEVPAIRTAVLDTDGSVRAETSVECGSRWREQELGLEEIRGQTVFLVMEVPAAPAGGVVELRRVRLLPETTEADVRESPVQVAELRAQTVEQRLPDVLLVILDAARADHFGFSGYARDTTPNLDRLASEALVFERAYAECSTTTCSIPNLISGVLFLDVGTVFDGRGVPDEVVTLAEYLQPLGYRSIAMSSNPNNSPRRKTDQGFDEFLRVPRTTWLTELALQRIAEQPAEQPLFLELHYLPPHQPYSPGPGFDLFTDPEYQGPVSPNVKLRPYSLGTSTFTEADVEQLMGLYDGNLRWVDDRVSQVFEAMKSAGRWDDAIVIVTSDHGEGFGEHGHYSHNSTLFDEMIHVPLVLKLPGGARPDVDTARPVSLSDLVPTIIGYLGLQPRPEVFGIDLLAASSSSKSERFQFHRTFHRGMALLGVQGKRWKAIDGNGFRSPMLFDLESDPGETDNLAAGRPELYAGLMILVRDFLDDWQGRMPESTEDIELPEHEIEALKALGYVE